MPLKEDNKAIYQKSDYTSFCHDDKPSNKCNAYLNPSAADTEIFH